MTAAKAPREEEHPLRIDTTCDDDRAPNFRVHKARRRPQTPRPLVAPTPPPCTSRGTIDPALRTGILSMH